MEVEASQFIAAAEEIIDQGQKYELGKDGSHGQCDCIGLIIELVRRLMDELELREMEAAGEADTMERRRQE